MRRFLINILQFGIVFFLIDKILFLLLFISPSLEKDDRLEKLINGEINKEIIIIGSSRGARNILASEIEKKTGKPTFNLSYPGSNMEFHEFILRTLLKFNQKPETIILVLDDPTFFINDITLEFRYERFYPLTRYNHIVQEMIDRGEKNLLTKYFALGRLSKTNFNFQKIEYSSLDSIAACGSMPISFALPDSVFRYDSYPRVYPQIEEDENKINAYIRFQERCLRENIKLITVFPPNFRAHNQSFENRVRELSLDKNVLYIYDQDNKAYLDSKYYYDSKHLKDEGAKIFTNEIVANLF